MSERRRAKRIDIDVSIKLNELKSDIQQGTLDTAKMVDVEVVNISKDGLAFRSDEKLERNTFYDANVVLWTKETFDAVLEIVRIEEFDNEPTLYGCRFIGILPSDQLKIQIYDMLQEAE